MTPDQRSRAQQVFHSLQGLSLAIRSDGREESDAIASAIEVLVFSLVPIVRMLSKEDAQEDGERSH